MEFNYPFSLDVEALYTSVPLCKPILQSGNKVRVAKVVHYAILAYHSKWNGRRAEKLAVFFVRFAWVHFGVFSMPYIQALLCLVTVFIRFRPKDPFTVEVAKNAVSYADLLFACPTPLLAQARLLLSRALVAAEVTENADFLKVAKAAQKDAIDCLGSKHPSLAWYNLGLGEALLFKARTSSVSTSLPSTLSWAENEVSKALEKFKDHFGDISIPTCEARITLAGVLEEKGRHEEAVKVLNFVDEVFRLCSGPHTHVVLNFCARFARTMREFAFSLAREEELSDEEKKEVEAALRTALRLARRVTETTECYGCYTPWVDECFKIQSETFRAQDLPSNANEMEQERETWLSENNSQSESFNWASLHEAPDAKFLEEWDLWGKHKQSLLPKLLRLRREGTSSSEGAPEVDPEDEEDFGDLFVPEAEPVEAQ